MLVTSLSHVMTISTWINTKPRIFVDLGNPNYHKIKKRSISLALIQAEIGTECIMTSWRHLVTLFHHATTILITMLSWAAEKITETRMESALKHICRLRWRKWISWRHVLMAMTSWRHVMIEKHHANTYMIIVWNSAIEISTEINMYYHLRTATSW